MDPSPNLSTGQSESPAESAWWFTLAVIFKQRWLLLIGAIVIGVISIGISLILPTWYRGVATVMIPQTINRAEMAVSMGDIGPAAAAFLSGATGDFNRYQTILQSRTVRERLIDEFDLISRYELAGEKAPLEETLDRLDQLIGLQHDIEFDYLIVSVLDRDATVAADMTNFLVDELNRVNAELESANAAKNRAYLEQRYADVLTDLDSVRAVLQDFQETHGVIELEAQTEAFLTMIATYRAEALVGEVEYEALRLSYGADNPFVQSARNRIRAAQRKENDLRSGQSAILPVAFDALPTQMQQFARLKQEALIRAHSVEIVRPLLEQARFEEIKATPAVQVLDQAEPPYEKAKPRRTLVVVGLTAMGCLLLLSIVVLSAWWQINAERIRTQLRRP